jgi:hydroxymethylbilane synthase
VGTRGSKLALWQAEHVIGRLREARTEARFEVVTIRTTGDKRQDVPLREIGDKSLFIKEIEAALSDGAIDLAVHSLKDVPSRLDARFELAAVLERDDPRDVLLTAAGGGLDLVGQGGRAGTSSLRREAQLRLARPDLVFLPIRGNVDTRLRKLRDGEYDAIVLAAAGLNRLDVPIPSEAFLDTSVCLPSPGQAAICVEALAGNREVLGLVSALDHVPTRSAVEAERAFAAELDAGCRVPVAAYATATPSPAAAGEGRGEGALEASLPELHLQGLVAASDGSRVIRVQARGRNPIELGRLLACEALELGAAELLHLA